MAQSCSPADTDHPEQPLHQRPCPPRNAECFIEYQLAAQQIASNYCGYSRYETVAMAYRRLKSECGGYEVVSLRTLDRPRTVRAMQLLSKPTGTGGRIDQ